MDGRDAMPPLPPHPPSTSPDVLYQIASVVFPDAQVHTSWRLFSLFVVVLAFDEP